MAAASAPEPARPAAASTSGLPGAWCTSANRSPPMPHMCWVVTARTALAAMAASAAEPPRRKSATPASEARWSTEQTIPLGAWTVRPVASTSRTVARARFAGVSHGYPAPMTETDTTTTSRLRALTLVALLGAGSIFGAAACSDEDGDGGETDEEIQDIEDGVD